MRIKSNWYQSGRAKSPQEIADALAFVAWRIGDNVLKQTRLAHFSINVGEEYFLFLSEVLVFLVQVADRIAYRQLLPEGRAEFTTTLANRLAETFAENQSRLLGGTLSDTKQQFIDKLNLRADEYAEFSYTEAGPEFAFLRYLAYCIASHMGERDSIWITDQMMSIEAPEAVKMLEKTMRDLSSTELRKPRPARPARVKQTPAID
jgi:hypothetical protein